MMGWGGEQIYRALFGAALDSEHVQHVVRPLAQCADALKAPFSTQFRRYQERQVGLPQTLGSLGGQSGEPLVGGRFFKLIFQRNRHGVADVRNHRDGDVLCP